MRGLNRVTLSPWSVSSPTNSLSAFLNWSVKTDHGAGFLNWWVRTPTTGAVLEFPVNMPAQSLVVTAARLIYKKFEYNTRVEMNKEAFVPAGVIDARYAG